VQTRTKERAFPIATALVAQFGTLSVSQRMLVRTCGITCVGLRFTCVNRRS
jgi:hypothetical protein